MKFRKFAINYLSPVTLFLRFWVYIAAVVVGLLSFFLINGGGFYIILGLISGYYAIKLLIKAVKPWYDDGYSINDISNGVDQVQKGMENYSRKNADDFRDRWR